MTKALIEVLQIALHIVSKTWRVLLEGRCHLLQLRKYLPHRLHELISFLKSLHSEDKSPRRNPVLDEFYCHLFITKPKIPFLRRGIWLIFMVKVALGGHLIITPHKSYIELWVARGKMVMRIRFYTLRVKVLYTRGHHSSQEYYFRFEVKFYKC